MSSSDRRLPLRARRRLRRAVDRDPLAEREDADARERQGRPGPARRGAVVGLRRPAPPRRLAARPPPPPAPRAPTPCRPPPPGVERVVFVGDSLVNRSEQDHGLLGLVRTSPRALAPRRRPRPRERRQQRRLHRRHPRAGSPADVLALRPAAVVLYWDSDAADVEDADETPGALRARCAPPTSATSTRCSRPCARATPHVVVAGPTLLGERPRGRNPQGPRPRRLRADQPARLPRPPRDVGRHAPRRVRVAAASTRRARTGTRAPSPRTASTSTPAGTALVAAEMASALGHLARRAGRRGRPSTPGRAAPEAAPDCRRREGSGIQSRAHVPRDPGAPPGPGPLPRARRLRAAHPDRDRPRPARAPRPRGGPARRRGGWPASCARRRSATARRSPSRSWTSGSRRPTSFTGCGPAPRPRRFHFDSPPTDADLDRARDTDGAPFAGAAPGALRRRSPRSPPAGTSLPLGISIGPFSLLTKLARRPDRRRGPRRPRRRRRGRAARRDRRAGAGARRARRPPLAAGAGRGGGRRRHRVRAGGERALRLAPAAGQGVPGLRPIRARAPPPGEGPPGRTTASTSSCTTAAS